jgi:hypothetical protein
VTAECQNRRFFTHFYRYRHFRTGTLFLSYVEFSDVLLFNHVFRFYFFFIIVIIIYLFIFLEKGRGERYWDSGEQVQLAEVSWMLYIMVQRKKKKKTRTSCSRRRGAYCSRPKCSRTRPISVDLVAGSCSAIAVRSRNTCMDAEVFMWLDLFGLGRNKERALVVDLKSSKSQTEEIISTALSTKSNILSQETPRLKY